jgi:hypothetical protein
MHRMLVREYTCSCIFRMKMPRLAMGNTGFFVVSMRLYAIVLSCFARIGGLRLIPLRLPCQ